MVGIFSSRCKVLCPLLALFFGVSDAYAPQSVRRCGIPLAPRLRFSREVKLRYRELDEQDDDTAMVKVQTRAPPGFDMRENLRNHRRHEESAINMPLIRALLINQGLILALATFATFVIVLVTDGFEGLSQIGKILNWSGGDAGVDLLLTPSRLGIGLLGAIPIIALGDAVENSDNRAFANVNFSTITMVMTLFGRRKAPPDEFVPENLKGKKIPSTDWTDALLQSLALASVTGFCEELVFRLEAPSLINHYIGGFPVLPLLGQATLFGLGHSSPGTNIAENGIVIGLQVVNGFLFGMIYLATGGDLVPCMIAHATYDFCVFFKTWRDSNEQIEYAETMFLEPLPPQVQQEVDDVLGANSKINPKLFNTVKRLFFTFDFDKNKTLSKSEVRKGFSYLALEKAGIPPPQEQVDYLFDSFTSEVDKSRLSFSDFLRLYASTRQGQAIAGQ